jgi:hypothetical protein
MRPIFSQYSVNNFSTNDDGCADRARLHSKMEPATPTQLDRPRGKLIVVGSGIHQG